MSRMMEELARRLEGFEGKQAKVGWFDSAKYEDGTPVASVAVIQEFGAPAAHIPPRPFMRPTIAEKKSEWIDNLRKGAQAVIAGRASADDVLTQVGAQAAGHIRQAIGEVREPALAESTLAQRARDGYTDQPLNRTGLMITSLTNITGNAE